jgi:2-polyprenyl-6-methoxyphenol hydroxylase-like FAD-dependent oxidoreductase
VRADFVWAGSSENLGGMSNMAGRGRIPLLVIGGGIGGLAAAIAASKAGQPVQVIEKAEAFAELGAGLQLGPNATRMLDRLGILAAVRRKAMFPRCLVMRDAVSGQHITSLDLGEKFLKHFEYPYLVMHRGDLLAAELAACQASDLITLEAHKEVVAIEDLGDGACMTCADGSTYECEALIGADGLWSHTRKVVHDDGEPICAQYVAYRGTIPVEEAPEGSDLENMTIWVGPEMHFVQYVVHEGTLFNQVAVFRSHRYQPGHEYVDDWGTAEELDERFRTLCPRVRSAVTKIKRNRRWPMFDRLPIPNWTRGHITLLGDAAHPMLQYIAQGACQALEDAVCLGESLSKYQNNPAQAFAAYQESRIPRSARVQRAARLFGELMHLDGVARAIRNELLHQRAAGDFKYCEFLYGYHEATSDADRRQQGQSPV